MATANEPALWERQVGEGQKAYEAFCKYRDMGTQRSLRKVAEELQKSETLMGRWSGQWEWVKRAEAWDREQDKIAQRQQFEEIKKMRKRHADLAVQMLLKAARALQRIPEDEIKAQDISRFVETASKLERISRGDVETVIEERQGTDAPDPVTFYIPSNNRDVED